MAVFAETIKLGGVTPERFERGYMIVANPGDKVDLTGLELVAATYSVWWENNEQRMESERARNDQLKKEMGAIDAAMKKNADIAIGNIVGSCIFNILFIMIIKITIYQNGC